METADAIHRIQFFLIDSNSCSAKQLVASGSLLSRPDYEDVVIERSISGFCGYPTCSNPLPARRGRRARYRVSLQDHRVYDLEETYKYCSEECLISSRTFCAVLNEVRVLDGVEAKVQQVLRFFGYGKGEDEGSVGEGDFLSNDLSIKEKELTVIGEVSLGELVGTESSIEGYVPLRYRDRDSAQRSPEKQIKDPGNSPMIAKLEETTISEKKETTKKASSKSSKATTITLNEPKYQNSLPLTTKAVSKTLVEQLEALVLVEKASTSEVVVIELEDEISSEKKMPTLKSSLKTSGSRIGTRSVKWADEEKHGVFVDKKDMPQELAGEDVVGSSISSELDEAVFGFDRDTIKWPNKTVLSDGDMFEDEDAWYDMPPEGFSLNLSPFATMWMLLFEWMNCSSLAYIYGCDDGSYEDSMVVNGVEYPTKVVLRDGKSSEIRQTLDGLVSRILPEIAKDFRLPVPISTLEKFLGCLIDTMSFMDAIPSLKIRQWHVVVVLFLEALSVHRLPALAPPLMNRDLPLKQVLNAARISIEEYGYMRAHILPLGTRSLSKASGLMPFQFM